MKRTLTILILTISLTTVASDQESTKESYKHYEKALQSMTQGDLTASFIHTKNALQLDPENLSAKLLLGEIFFNDGDLYSAEQTFREAIEEGADINLALPLYGASLILQRKADEVLTLKKYKGQFSKAAMFEWHLLRGQAYLQKGNIESAKHAMDMATHVEPSNTRALNTLASYYVDANELQLAQDLVNRSLVISRDNEKTWLLKGDIATREGDIVSALEFYRHGYELAPQDHLILRNLAKAYLDLKDPTNARKYLEAILEQSPNDPSASLLLAVISLGEGEAELGQQMLGDLSSRLSNTEGTGSEQVQVTLFIRAATEFIQGNNEKARTLLGNYLLNNPGDIAAIRMLANLHLKNSNTKQTILLLESYNKAASRDFGLTYTLANLYISEGKLFTATQEIQKLQQMAPGHPLIYMLEADILNAQGKPKEALKLLSQQKFQGEPPLAFSLKLGRIEIANGQLEQALATSDKLLKKYPSTPSVLNFAAAAKLKNNEVSEAKQLLEKVIALTPNDLTARFNHILTLKMEGQLEDAVSMAKELLNDSPEHIPTIVLIANIRAAEKNYTEALEWLDKVNAYDRMHIGANELRLRVLTQSGDLERAVKAAQFLYKNGKNSTRYLAQEAELQIALERYDAANKPLVLLYSLWENQPQQLRRLADLQIRANNLKAARKSLEKALSLGSDSLPIQLELARLSLREGDLETAKQSIQQLNSHFGDHSYIELLAADLASEQDQKELARKHYTQAFTLDKNNSKALLMLYQLTLDGVGEAAFTNLLEKERKKGPIPSWAQKLLADSYLNQGQLQLAQARYEQLLTNESLSNNSAILNNLANIYAKSDLDKALTTAKKALDNNGRNPSLLDTIGWIYLEKDMPTDALFYLREASALDSSNPEIRYHQGVALARLNRNPEAIREFKTALQLSDDFNGASEARTWLNKLQN